MIFLIFRDPHSRRWGCGLINTILWDHLVSILVPDLSCEQQDSLVHKKNQHAKWDSSNDHRILVPDVLDTYPWRVVVNSQLSYPKMLQQEINQWFYCALLHLLFHQKAKLCMCQVVQSDTKPNVCLFWKRSFCRGDKTKLHNHLRQASTVICAVTADKDATCVRVGSTSLAVVML